MSSLPALIPAAGRGTRLRPITRYVSKPMLPLGSRPVVSYTVDEAQNAGCQPVVVIRSPGDDDLLNFLETEYGTAVKIVEQPRPKGLADAALRGYETLDAETRCALMLPDNVVLGGSGIGSLLNTTLAGLVLGTTAVSEGDARYFGNSGRYESRSVEGENHERITALQKKGSGSFLESADQWPTRRAVARTLVPPEFFERVRNREPDPESGEIDDVPIYRAMIESSVVFGVPIDGEIHDMGTPERYLRLNGILHGIRTSDTDSPD